MPSSFNLGWLSNFKILSWALNRGALCAQRFTPAQFVAVYALPITPLHSADDASAAAAPVTPSGPAAGTRSRTHGDGSAKPGGSSASLASGATSQGDAPPPAALPRRGSRGRLADDAGGPGRMAQNWAGKNLLLGVCLVALRHQLPGFIESFILGLGECFFQLRPPLARVRRYGVCSALRCPAAAQVAAADRRAAPPSAPSPGQACTCCYHSSWTVQRRWWWGWRACA